MTFARLLIACLALVLVTAPVQAARYPHYPLLIAQRDQGGNGGISLDEAVAQARQQYNGKVLSAEFESVPDKRLNQFALPRVEPGRSHAWAHP